MVEGLCYQNFDKPDDPEAEECEVYIQRRVPALSTVIFRIAKDMSHNIAINTSTTEFTLSNNFYNVSIPQDILSLNASELNLTLTNAEGENKSVTFDFRYYKNFQGNSS